MLSLDLLAASIAITTALRRRQHPETCETWYDHIGGLHQRLPRREKIKRLAMADFDLYHLTTPSFERALHLLSDTLGTATVAEACARLTADRNMIEPLGQLFEETLQVTDSCTLHPTGNSVGATAAA